MADLFIDTEVKAPLAARVRPRHLDEYVRQSHLLGAGKPLRICVESGNLHSMILWGPPGVGKTSFARLLADTAQAHFETISAVQAGVKEIRVAAEKAKNRRELDRKSTRLNSSHVRISYAVFCLKKKKTQTGRFRRPQRAHLRHPGSAHVSPPHWRRRRRHAYRARGN